MAENDITKHLNFSLYPKQALALNTPANEVFFGGAAGPGKALALNTPVYTTDGLKTIATLEVGDNVYNEFGLPTLVIAKSQIWENRITYKFTFSTEESIISSAEHLWVIDLPDSTETLTSGEIFALFNTGKSFSIYSYDHASVREIKIVSVEKILPQKTQCIQVLNVSGIFLVGETKIPTHNSFLLRAAAIMWAAECPGIQIYLFRRTFPDLEKNHMNGDGSFPTLLAAAAQQKLVRIDGNRHKILFKNGPAGTYHGGSVIHLSHCQYEKDMFNYQGPEIHVLLMDELTHFTDSIYTYLRGRLRLGGWKPPPKYKGFFPKIISASNPGGPGHNVVKHRFIDFADSDNIYRIKRAPESDGGMLRQFIPAFITDNPTLMENDPTYVDRLKGLGTPELVSAMLRGDWDIVSGGMFDDVWDKDTHVIAPFDIPNSWYINRSFDWGSSKPFSVQWWAESDGSMVTLENGIEMSFPRGTLFNIAEYYGCNRDTPNRGLKLSNVEIGYNIRDKELNDPVLMKLEQKIYPGPADASIYTRLDEDSYAEKINEGYWGSSNSRHNDIFFPSDKSPGTRVKRWGLMRDRFQAGLCLKDKQLMESAGLFIFNSCREAIRTIPIMPRSLNNPDDIDTEAEDHIADSYGYRVLQKSARLGKAKFSWG